MTNYLSEGSWSLSKILLCATIGAKYQTTTIQTGLKRNLLNLLTRSVMFIRSHGLWLGPCTTAAHPTCTLLILVGLQDRTTGSLINSPLAFHRVKLSDIMDTPARNMKLQQRMDTFLLFTEFPLGGMTEIQVWHSYRTQGRPESQLLHGFPIFPLCTCNGIFHTFPSPQEHLVRRMAQILNPSEVHTFPVSVLISDSPNNFYIQGSEVIFPSNGLADRLVNWIWGGFTLTT